MQQGSKTESVQRVAERHEHSLENTETMQNQGREKELSRRSSPPARQWRGGAVKGGREMGCALVVDRRGQRWSRGRGGGENVGGLLLMV
ncbi:hypothetical protein RND71_014490 [Anisodus tanguticus]|uniref:Uncharacterized protein n=1 Tax=Anisodus tanguticus TaxID=243964 RepID=A0AAE1VNP7_9SOLA|nr:hypothetical protein RND71_014490 [Anisodus tanguticus]